jgi:hypothetical protein
MSWSTQQRFDGLHTINDVSQEWEREGTSNGVCRTHKYNETMISIWIPHRRGEEVIAEVACGVTTSEATSDG